MIISNVRFTRDIALAEKTNAIMQDKAFLVKQFSRHLKREFSEVSQLICQSDPKFDQTLSQAVITAINSIGIDSPNTAVMFRLPDSGPIRGENEVFYDRITINKYFGIGSMNVAASEITDHSGITAQKHKEVVIDWDKWAKAYNDGTLDNLLHRELGYQFGRTFAHQGVYVIGHEKMHVKSTHPLAILVPDLKEVEHGWLHMNDITPVLRGSVPYQHLNVYLRLVSSNHLFIEDGEIMIRIRLRRELQHYNKKHEGVTHVD